MQRHTADTACGTGTDSYIIRLEASDLRESMIEALRDLQGYQPQERTHRQGRLRDRLAGLFSG